MGIRSLTTYLEQRSTQYFENYKLSNCDLVIDGHNLSNNLYNWQYTYWKTGFSPYCYGGDYDKYAEIVKRFFEMLQECNVTPYIIFDGCSENDKSSFIKERLNENAKVNSQITPTSSHSYAIGAVALRYAFKDVVQELELKAYTCISHANRRMASLARHLNCPVLSSDSDFFISSDLFIPFASIDLKSDHRNQPYKFIVCKIYKIDNLINVLSRRPNMHYLLPVLIDSQFSTGLGGAFYRKFKLVGTRQAKIDLIVLWLKRHTTLENAIIEILRSFNRNTTEQCLILKAIKNTIMGYTSVSITSIEQYFDIAAKKDNGTILNLQEVEKALGLTTVEADLQQDIQVSDLVSELFEKKFTEGIDYPPFFLDMLMGNRYFVWPNIEDCSKPDANSIGYNIMSAIHKILVQTDDSQLTVLRRDINDIQLKEFLLPAYKDPLPPIEEVEYLRLEGRQDIIFKILEIDPNFRQIFKGLPENWHLFLVSLKYTTSKSQLNPAFIYSLIFCFLIVNYVDPKLKGFYRSTKDLYDVQKRLQDVGEEAVDEGTKFSTITREDAIVFMLKVIKYFEQDSEENAETYDRGIMHSIAEFQCVFLHLKYLNALLNYPFKDVFIYKVFDGTFIYNMVKNLQKQPSLENYLSIFLQDSLSIYCVITSVIELLEPI